MADLQAYVDYIIRFGPHRVLIEPDVAVATYRAGFIPDLIFIRDDGWSLGAPSHLAPVAEAMWKDKWVGVLIRPRTAAMPYAVYANTPKEE